MVVNGVAGPGLLDASEPERVHASVENLAITGRTARFMCPITVRDRIRQQVVLRAATRIPAARRFVDSGSFYQPTCYPSGSGSTGPATSPIVGAIFPDARIKDERSGSSRLGELLRHGIVVLWSPGSDADNAGIDDVRREGDEQPNLRLSVIEIGSETASHVTHPQHHLVTDIDGALQRLLRPVGTPPDLSRAVILRPDAHVAAVLDIPSGQSAAERIRSALHDTFQLI
jgi:3-(3-hydroxy-phenyl)propionate hydroxylase